MRSLPLKGVKDNQVMSESQLVQLDSGWMALPGVPAPTRERIKGNAKRRIDIQGLEDAELSLSSQVNSETDPKKKKALQRQLNQARTGITRLKILLKQDTKTLSLTTPINIRVSLNETQQGNDFLVKLGTYLVDNSATIAKPQVDQLDPVKREAIKATEDDQADSLRIAAIEAVAAHSAEEAKTGKERDEAKIGVAEIKAAQACRKLRAAGYDDVTCLGHG